jgi:hypothetical protein
VEIKYGVERKPLNLENLPTLRYAAPVLLSAWLAKRESQFTLGVITQFMVR